jgi:hypothetical protein
METRADLPDENVTGQHFLTGVAFHATKLRVGITTVA